MVLMDKYVQFNFLHIKEPRWHDKRVLLACSKVGEHNKVVITQTKEDGTRYFPEPLYISGKNARKYKRGSNGVIPCYEVPLDAFDTLVLSERSMHEM